MLNLEKVKLMNHLAMYENNAGKTYLPISKFYRSDYIGMALIKNFFLVTIGYLLLVAVIFAYFAEYLLSDIIARKKVSSSTIFSLQSSKECTARMKRRTVTEEPVGGNKKNDNIFGNEAEDKKFLWAV